MSPMSKPPSATSRSAKPVTTAEPLVSSERASLSDDLVSFGPDAPTILEGWTAQELLDHLIMRERRPDLLIGPHVPVPAIAARAERERARLREVSWAQQVERFRAGPPRFSPVRGLDGLMNTAEYVVHHEDLRRARPGWTPRDLGDAAQRELWSVLRRMAPLLVRAQVDITLVSPLGGIRVPARSSSGSVRVHGPSLELLMWAFGRDRVARVRVDGEPQAIIALNRGARGI